MTEKLKSIDGKRLMFTLVIIAVSINMAFARDHVMNHLTLPAFIWSVFVIKEGRIRLDIGDALIFPGMMLFMWIYRGRFLEGLSYGILCTVIYQVGKYTATGLVKTGQAFPYSEDEQNRSLDRVVKVIMALAVALFMRGLLNYHYTLKWKKKSKIFKFRIKITTDMYDKTFVRTEQGFFLVLMACMLICFLYILIRKSIAVGIAGIILSCCAAWLDIYKRGRMVACCTAVTALLVLVAIGLEKKLYKRKWIQISGAVAAGLLIAFIIAVRINLFGLGDWYTTSMWVRDGGVLGNIRFTIMRNALKEIAEHPLTGSDAPLFSPQREAIAGLAHDSWLDIGIQSGLAPMILTLAFTVTNIMSLFSLWKKSTDVRKYVMIAGFAGITLYNMFEPAILNYIVFWIAEVFMGGLAKGLGCTVSGGRELTIRLKDE